MARLIRGLGRVAGVCVGSNEVKAVRRGSEEDMFESECTVRMLLYQGMAKIHEVELTRRPNRVTGRGGYVWWQKFRLLLYKRKENDFEQFCCS